MHRHLFHPSIEEEEEKKIKINETVIEKAKVPKVLSAPPRFPAFFTVARPLGCPQPPAARSDLVSTSFPTPPTDKGGTPPSSTDFPPLTVSSATRLAREASIQRTIPSSRDCSSGLGGDGGPMASRKKKEPPLDEAVPSHPFWNGQSGKLRWEWSAGQWGPVKRWLCFILWPLTSRPRCVASRYVALRCVCFPPPGRVITGAARWVLVCSTLASPRPQLAKSRTSLDVCCPIAPRR
ncbi:hypothetical protein LX32DRAFT_391256 [Colletotrichum zoysiae]|uniref:Uncharacterized protein n=1 Tax=Colletotrichum zoysiae TaxID=1216348 RepID=A0AAD9HGK5_9PEZI|nr:hypothetical protein LX32DRAFT_391256 [Colletotrichum zoysiae]